MTWTNITSAQIPPPEHYGGQLVWDPGDNASIWFAIGANYTWSWGGTPPLAGLAILATPSPAGVGQAVAYSSTHVGGRGPYTFAWTFGDGGANVSSSPTHTYQSSGYFLVSLTLKDATGNSATATLSLFVDASAMEAIKANPDPTDVGVPVVFQAEIESGPGGLTYDWTFGDGYASSTASPVHTYQATGSYLVNVTATAPGGGQINASILIGVAPDLTTPVVTANPLTPELGQLVNLTARELAGAPPYSYSWAFGDGGVGGNMSAISHIFTTSGPFSTVVTVTDSTGQRTAAR